MSLIEEQPIPSEPFNPYGAAWDKVEDGAVGILVIVTVLTFWLRGKVSQWFDGQLEALEALTKQSAEVTKWLHKVTPEIYQQSENLKTTKRLAEGNRKRLDYIVSKVREKKRD